MSETKTIDMSVCIGSDTLCEYRFGEELFKCNGEIFELIKKCRHEIRVAQDHWQSTSNKIVVPNGLICDVQYIEDGFLGKFFSLNSEDELKSFDLPITAIRVTGIAQGWSYSWQQDQRGGE